MPSAPRIIRMVTRTFFATDVYFFKWTRLVVPRIFASLSVLTVLSLLVAMWLGLGLDLNKPLAAWKMLQDEQMQKGRLGTLEGSVEWKEMQSRIEKTREEFLSERESGSIHILVGIGATLFVVLVCSISVTYFIGTGRWCREVIEVYGLAPEILRENQLLKLKSFPWALIGILTALAISALGAAADPGTGMASTDRWVMPHLFAALAGICLISYCLYALWGCIVRNHRVIDLVMREVRTRRTGLELDREEGNSSNAMNVGKL